MAKKKVRDVAGPSYITPDLWRLAKPIDSFHHDPHNARLHPERNAAALRASLEQYGQMKPIVVQKQGMIIRAGNGLVEAARELGWEQVAAVVFEAEDLRAIGFALADNRTAELSEWDPIELSAMVDVLEDCDLIGWEPPELEALLGNAEIVIPEDAGPADPDDGVGDVVVEIRFSVEIRDEALAAIKGALSSFDGVTIGVA